VRTLVRSVAVAALLSITPVANFLWGNVGDVKSESTLWASGWKQTIFEFGLDLTIH
jgi:hypothetical protein